MSAVPIIKNPLLDKDFINAFIDGVSKTLSTMAQTEIFCGKPYVETKFNVPGDVAGMVGMVAPPLKGILIISYSKEAIFTIVENMIGEKHTEISKDVGDAVGELTNMIYGSAKTTLNQRGYKFEMAIPTVVKGQFLATKQQDGATLVVPFTLSNQTTFCIAITVK